MRPRLTSLRSRGDGGRKPRFGRRRCSGIWPPSKPLIRTPERAVWPLPPRPACLPLPEPMPRPTRIRALDEPGLSEMPLSFMFVPYRSRTAEPPFMKTSFVIPAKRESTNRPALRTSPFWIPAFAGMTALNSVVRDLFHDAHEMRDLGDHAAYSRRIDHGGAPADPIEAEADQRLALLGAPADGAADLLDGDFLAFAHGASLRNPRRRLRRPDAAIAASIL